MLSSATIALQAITVNWLVSASSVLRATIAQRALAWTGRLAQGARTVTLKACTKKVSVHLVMPESIVMGNI